MAVRFGLGLLFCLLGLASATAQEPREEMLFNPPVEGQPLERCVITKRLPGAAYSERDQAAELSLCSMSFYEKVTAQPNVRQVASCPKTNSTSLGVDVYEMPPEATLDDFRKEVCTIRIRARKRLRRAKGYPVKIAKFKFSFAGVSSGSMLAYYHVSRLFGIGNVPPVVVRTVDRTTMADMALAGWYLTRNKRGKGWRSIIRYNYNRFVSLALNPKLENGGVIPQEYRRNSRAFGLIPADHGKWSIMANSRMGKRQHASASKRALTSDGRQFKGALTENVRGEKIYKGMYGRNMNSPRRFPIFNLLTKDAPLSELLGGRDFYKVGQKLKRMIDLNGLLVLDHLFSNADRLGNVHKVRRYYYRTPQGAIRSMHAKSYKKLSEQKKAQLNAVAWEELLLKDNDSGFDLNVVKEKRFVRRLRHFSPRIQKGLIDLHRAVFADSPEEMERYFKDDLLMSAYEYGVFKRNLKDLAEIVSSDPKMRFDLDLEQYFSNS